MNNDARHAGIKLRCALRLVLPTDLLLQEVVKLGDANKQTLGLLPRQAFSDYASKEGIVAAVTEESELAGYVLFRRSRNWTHIAHLCVAEAFHGQGVARQLVERVIGDSTLRQLFGVRLKCRRDYTANSLWNRFGFVPRADVAGRGISDTELTVWVLDHNENDLFSRSALSEPSLLRAVLDANVFYDLEVGQRSPGDFPEQSKEAQHLLADWISDAVELCLVDEIHSEIDRSADSHCRKLCRQHATRYRELVYTKETAEAFYQILQKILGWHHPSVQQRSDMRQVSKAAATDATLFVTRDESLLAKSDEIFNRLLIRVLRPLDLILSIDERENEARYAPAALHGTEISHSHCKHDSLDVICRAFLTPQGERLNDFKARVRDALSQSVLNKSSSVTTVNTADGRPFTLFAKIRITFDILKIPIFRTNDCKTASTIARHLLFSFIQETAETLGTRIEITDPFLPTSTIEALEELRFIKTGDIWVRETVDKIISQEDARLLVLEKPHATRGTGNTLSCFASLEESFWPMKVRESGLPCWIVPVHPEWARRLFDPRLSDDELFRPDALRLLNWENVYYRSAKPKGPQAPARILWYVTRDKRDARTGSIRACSRLIESEHGPATTLFKKNERLGVYEWPDLARALKEGPHQKIELLRFVDTEPLPSPLSLENLRMLGGGKMLQSPLRIEESLFFRIYEAAKQPC